jgi:hypothetical protein
MPGLRRSSGKRRLGGLGKLAKTRSRRRGKPAQTKDRTGTAANARKTGQQMQEASIRQQQSLIAAQRQGI